MNSRTFIATYVVAADGGANRIRDLNLSIKDEMDMVGPSMLSSTSKLMK